MRQVSSRITERGQATIPVEVRRLLGLEPHDRIVFVIGEDGVQVARGTSAVDRTAGAMRSSKQRRGVREVRVAAEIAIARDAVRRTAS